MVVGCALEDDRPEQLAGQRRRQLVRTELVGDAELLVGDEQEQAQQLGLDRGHGAQDVADRQGVRRGEHGVRGDARAAAVAAPTCAGPDAARGGDAPIEDLAQDALLDAGHLADLLERLVAPERVGDVARWPA